MSNSITFNYIDSLNSSHELSCEPMAYNSLMELISDICLEDWGDCRGRAWCATCHVCMNSQESTNADEELRLQQLSNRTSKSRLACQIPLDTLIKNKTIAYLGDD